MYGGLGKVLRCIKWLPFACVGVFALFVCLGSVLNPEKRKQRPIAPVQHGMTFFFVAYDINGQIIPSVTLVGSVQTNKQSHDVGQKDLITVKPNDDTHYEAKTQEVLWLNKEQFLNWLKGDFQKELRDRGAKPEKWKTAIDQLERAAIDTSCNYPVILEPR
jgi:hypothetical protein